MRFWWDSTVLFLFLAGLIHRPMVGLTLEHDHHARLYIGGSEVANIEDAPYTAALLVEKDGEPQTFCTASIVSEKWVLTAAHCVFLPTDAYLIAAGSNSSDEIEDEFHKGKPNFPPTNGSIQIRRTIKIVKHPRYKELTDGNDFVARFDVALCNVESWSFGRSINQIALFDETWDGGRDPGEEYRFQNCTSFGWGMTEREKQESSSYLRTSIFKVQHGTRACTCYKPYINRRMLCTGANEEGHSACPGDSGGPLVCRNKLAGVAHIGYYSGYCLFEPFVRGSRAHHSSPLDLHLGVQCGAKNLVTAWMYVCPVLGWIGEHVQGAPRPPLSCRSPPLPALSPFITTFLILRYFSGRLLSTFLITCI